MVVRNLEGVKVKMLDKTEINILIDIYEMDLNNGKRISETDYGFEEISNEGKKQALAWHLFKLRRLKYISFDENTFITGGWHHPKYNNNVIMYYAENIHITEKGILYVDEIRKTVLSKVKDGGIEILGKVYTEIKDLTAKTIAEFFFKLIQK